MGPWWLSPEPPGRAGLETPNCNPAPPSGCLPHPHRTQQNLFQRFVLIFSVSSSLGQPHCPPRHWADTGHFSQHLLSTRYQGLSLSNQSASLPPQSHCSGLPPQRVSIPARPTRQKWSSQLPLPSSPLLPPTPQLLGPSRPHVVPCPPSSPSGLSLMPTRHSSIFFY